MQKKVLIKFLLPFLLLFHCKMFCSRPFKCSLPSLNCQSRLIFHFTGIDLPCSSTHDFMSEALLTWITFPLFSSLFSFRDIPWQLEKFPFSFLDSHFHVKLTLQKWITTFVTITAWKSCLNFYFIMTASPTLCTRSYRAKMTEMNFRGEKEKVLRGRNLLRSFKLIPFRALWKL